MVTRGGENVIGVIVICKIVIYFLTYLKLVLELPILGVMFSLPHKQLSLLLSSVVGQKVVSHAIDNNANSCIVNRVVTNCHTPPSLLVCVAHTPSSGGAHSSLPKQTGSLGPLDETNFDTCFLVRLAHDPFPEYVPICGSCTFTANCYLSLWFILVTDSDEYDMKWVMDPKFVHPITSKVVVCFHGRGNIYQCGKGSHLTKRLLESSVSWNHTLDKNGQDEQYIRIKDSQTVALRFWFERSVKFSYMIDSRHDPFAKYLPICGSPSSTTKC